MLSKYVKVILRHSGDSSPSTIFLKVDAGPDGGFVEPRAALHYGATHVRHLGDEIHGAEIEDVSWVSGSRNLSPLYYVGRGF